VTIFGADTRSTSTSSKHDDVTRAAKRSVAAFEITDFR
jgi:hypothetical protein